MVGGALDATAPGRHELMNLTPGYAINDRYRLHIRAWETGSGAVWVAHDEVLERPVLIQTFPDAATEAVGRAVARGAQLSHPGLCQIYDMSSDPPAIIFEHAPGGRLVDRKDGALPAADAARIACQLASAITALHEHGVAHGSISPTTVLFDEEGRPKLAGVLFAEELGAAADPSSDAYRPPGEGGSVDERDRYALAAVAYRLFTGREPGPDAPPPRSARRSIPPSVDALLSRALARDASLRPSLQEFKRVLDPIAAAEPRERGPGFFRQEMRWLAPILLVLGIGAAVAIGVQTNVIDLDRTPATTEATPTASAYRVVSVEDFDPPPRGSGDEHPEDVGKAIDGKDDAWSTVGYQTEALGGLKEGVGLLFDLGSPRQVGRIEVRTPMPGWHAEWRASDSEGQQADSFTLVQSFTATGEPVTLRPSRRAQYWLLWITRLVDSGTGDRNRFQVQVSEVQFFER